MARGDPHTCSRCGYQWQQRGEAHPRRCPAEGCRSPYWDVPRGELPIGGHGGITEKWVEDVVKDYPLQVENVKLG